MLKELKKNLGTDGRSRGVGKKMVAFLAFGAIILVFVFLGVAPDQLGAQGGGAAAQVNNATISVSQFRHLVERMEKQFGGSGAGFSQFIRQQAMESLIHQEVILQKSQEAGVLVSDDEIRDVILGIEAFQENGRFLPNRYESLLRYNRLSAEQFEHGVRKDIAGDRVRRLVSAALQPTQGQVQLQKKAQEQKASLEFVSFSRPELVEKLAKSLKYDGVVDEEMRKKVEESYQKNIAKYTQEEQVRARHILVKVGKISEQEAMKKIEELALRAKKEDFAALAKAHSEDVGSQAKGGDLGFFGRGRMHKVFEDKAFSMKEGEISEPLKSPSGYHLIQLVERKEAVVKPLDQVKDEVTRNVLAEQGIDEALEDLNEALKSSDSRVVQRFVKDYDLKWEKTGAFDLSAESVPKIGSSEDLLSQAFTLSQKEPWPGKLFTINGRTFLVKYSASSMGKKVSKKDSKKAKEQPVELSEQLATNYTEDAFQRLGQQWKEDSDIQRNENYLKLRQ